ncbi:MAG TPA: STAS domain-containing protein, partial [Candidatus Xenobia bacterium]
ERYLLRVQGTIDLSTQDEFHRALQKAASDETHPEVAIDLRGIDFIGTSGVSLILKTLHHLRDHRRSLKVIDCSPRAARVFSLLKVDYLLPAS